MRSAFQEALVALGIALGAVPVVSVLLRAFEWVVGS